MLPDAAAAQPRLGIIDTSEPIGKDSSSPELSGNFVRLGWVTTREMLAKVTVTESSRNKKFRPSE
jgi:hypothetical protein